MQKAAVFPVPVCAEPRISLPSKATGIACDCIGVGSLKSISKSARFRFLDSPNLSKLVINFSAMLLN